MSNVLNVSDISVVIPTHNRCELLKRAISSVLNQTICVREIIVVDNGSTDNTYEMITSLYPEITYVHEKRKGVSIARNLGITNMNLLTNNPSKRAGLEGYGLNITKRTPLLGKQTPENSKYLETKKDKMGHDFDDE